ncbi:hypothetical protein [Salinibacillus kushneri]|nr:hypothetical protein [Salinibacillus kushneri]
MDKTSGMATYSSSANLLAKLPSPPDVTKRPLPAIVHLIQNEVASNV